MTHQNHQTNGASLEDCHTNFFALTELYGIKWRKLVWGETSGGGDGEEGSAPLADPVISSYARCLAGDILCVWRRVPAPHAPCADMFDMSIPAPPPPPPLSLRAAKELWIFWYGEEPDLNGLVAPELIASQGDQGSWESGLSYECRSLLFKALHNLIERCLLSRDFVRLGKWFVQPYDGDEEDVGKSPWHLSFSFAFFLHGESTVCASVDVRQHPPVRTLTAKRLARLNAPDAAPDAKVILAPFGLEGRVSGREWGDGDPSTARLLDAWRQLYPLEHGCGAVEVVCGGVRMRYPAPYVLVTQMESPPADPPSPHALSARSLHALSTPKPHLTPELCYAESSSEKSEDIVDPTRKTNCSCAKGCGEGLRGGAGAGTCGGGAGAGGGGVSPGSCGASPAHPASAPPSAGAASASPPNHHRHAHTPHTHLDQTQCVPASLHTPAPTPDPLAPPTPAAHHHPPKMFQQGDSPAGACAGGGGGGASGAGGRGAGAVAELAKRPALPLPERRLDPMEDEHSLAMLYDYTTVYAWLEHPVKRFKSSENNFREELALGVGGAGADLYAGQEHITIPYKEHHIEIKQEKQEQNEDVKDYKNLYTSNGLCPVFRDLDQMFDNSDDASGDEALQVQTPPDSNKSMEESRRGGSANGGVVRAEELSKMFPTPPSMEAHAQPSPGFTLADDVHAHTHALVHAHAHTHLHHQLAPGAATPPIEPIEDWSYVFKPAGVARYVGSSKYAALPVLPSQLLPPVTLPPHAVYRPRPRNNNNATSNTNNNTNSSKHQGTKRSASPQSESASREVESRTSMPSPAVGMGGLPTLASVGGTRATTPSPAPAPAPTSPRAAPHACPLLINVLLGDTVLNVFRDHNFDSCTLCVCNAGPKVVGNIRGADAATYLSEEAGGGEEEPARCTCGFSAILNRRLAHQAGLFFEDELEITGLAEEPVTRTGCGLSEVGGAVLEACTAPVTSAVSALGRAARAAATANGAGAHDDHRLNLLEYSDGGAAALRALRVAAGVGTCAGVGAGAIHRWPFIGARAPRSSRDVVRLMRRLRPLLQDAIQKRCCGARMWDGVTGPLTWRQFHRLAGRGNDDMCEPQPVPLLLVGHDRDWISLSPYALRHWERLSLEPYSYSRDVAYVVLAAEGDTLTDPVRTFFRELSTAYESCRLGRHQPINRMAKDGLFRASPSDVRDTNYEEWTGTPPPGRLGEYMKAYAEILRSTIVPQLAALTVDKSLFESERTTQVERPQPSPMRPPSTPDHPPTPSSQSDQETETGSATSCGGGGGSTPNASSGGAGGGGGGGGSAGGGSSWWESGGGGSAGGAGGGGEGGEAALVVYVVEPPAAQAHRAAALHALLRLAAATHHHLHHHNPLVKIISLEGVMETWNGWSDGACGGSGETRALAFSVFTGARRLLAHAPNGKSLTGFGTAAHANLFINNKDEKNRAPYKLFSPAWVLGPGRALREVAETWGQGGEGSGVLFLCYCLSHDQRWLLAAATDARGELLDTAAINIHVPARSRRRRSGPARRLGLTKLMDFIVGLMSHAAHPWRLVVGRVGRIGHGELKGWSWLLSRKNLDRASSALRNACTSCNTLYPSGAPCILSACLVSTEPDPTMRLMADRFTPDERFSQASIQSHLHTPRDVTATHILVFPTSATTQSNQIPFEPQLANGDGTDMDMLLDMELNPEDMGDDNDMMSDIGDMFTNWLQSPKGRHDDDNAGSREGSPARHAHHATSYAHGGDTTAEQVGTVLQQPLALGYLVSTAPLGSMPAWWWAGCAHVRDACPAFVRSALLLHAGSVQAADDYASLTQRPNHNAHPLDSQTTTDVLRYVLENYNALSWLALDGNTHDRLSCLPIHVQVLMQLYHTAAALG